MQRLSEADFAAVFRLMEIAFPEDEYRSYEEQKNLLAEPAYKLFGIKTADTLLQ